MSSSSKATERQKQILYIKSKTGCKLVDAIREYNKFGNSEESIEAIFKELKGKFKMEEIYQPKETGQFCYHYCLSGVTESFAIPIVSDTDFALETIEASKTAIRILLRAKGGFGDVKEFTRAELSLFRAQVREKVTTTGVVRLDGFFCAIPCKGKEVLNQDTRVYYGPKLVRLDNNNAELSLDDLEKKARERICKT